MTCSFPLTNQFEWSRLSKDYLTNCRKSLSLMARSLFLTAVLWRPGDSASAVKFGPLVLTLEIVRRSLFGWTDHPSSVWLQEKLYLSTLLSHGPQTESYKFNYLFLVLLSHLGINKKQSGGVLILLNFWVC